MSRKRMYLITAPDIYNLVIHDSGFKEFIGQSINPILIVLDIQKSYYYLPQSNRYLVSYDDNVDIITFNNSSLLIRTLDELHHIINTIHPINSDDFEYSIKNIPSLYNKLI